MEHKSIQDSYRFLDPKFESFATFFQSNNFFFQTQGRWSTEILRMQEQSFFIVRCKHTGKFEWITFEQNEENFISKALLVALEKKNSRPITIFPDFISIFQTFSRCGKLLGKLHDFFKNSILCTNPVNRKVSAKVTFQFCGAKRQHTCIYSPLVGVLSNVGLPGSVSSRCTSTTYI